MRALVRRRGTGRSWRRGRGRSEGREVVCFGADLEAEALGDLDVFELGMIFAGLSRGLRI